MRTLAYEEGVRLYRLALSLGENDLDDEMLCRLYLGLARALNASTDIAGSVDASVRAAAVAQAVGRPDLLAEAALVREAIAPSPLEAMTQRLCQEALARVDTAHVPPDRDRRDGPSAGVGLPAGARPAPDPAGCGHGSHNRRAVGSLDRRIAAGARRSHSQLRRGTGGCQRGLQRRRHRTVRAAPSR